MGHVDDRLERDLDPPLADNSCDVLIHVPAPRLVFDQEPFDQEYVVRAAATAIRVAVSKAQAQLIVRRGAPILRALLGPRFLGAKVA